MDVKNLVILSLALTACASRPKATVDSELHRRLKSQEKELQALRDENRILKHKMSTPTEPSGLPLMTELTLPAPATVEVASATKVSTSAKTAGEATVVAEATTEASGDHLLYAKVIESFRAEQKEDLLRSVELLQKGFPESEHVDNALYLKGLYHFAHNELADALKTFRQVQEKYPESNKVVSSLFAEAMVLKKMSRRTEAEQKLKNVAKLFPGSPESQRVDLELRILSESK